MNNQHQGSRFRVSSLPRETQGARPSFVEGPAGRSGRLVERTSQTHRYFCLVCRTRSSVNRGLPLREPPCSRRSCHHRRRVRPSDVWVVRSASDDGWWCRIRSRFRSGGLARSYDGRRTSSYEPDSLASNGRHGTSVNRRGGDRRCIGSRRYSFHPRTCSRTNWSTGPIDPSAPFASDVGDAVSRDTGSESVGRNPPRSPRTCQAPASGDRPTHSSGGVCLGIRRVEFFSACLPKSVWRIPLQLSQPPSPC